MKIYPGVLIALLLGGTALADVQLEIQDMSGRTTMFTSNGNKTRIEGGSMPGYAIVDYSSGKLLMVDTSREEVLSATLGSGGVIVGGDSLSVSLLPRGGGHEIAGYATRKYELVANGENCGTIYGSRELMQVQEMRAMLDAMRGMRDFSRAMSAGVSGLLTACQRANMQLSGVVDAAGAPLLVLDAGGNRLSEVLSVDTGVRIDVDEYEVPSGMKVVSMDESMRQAADTMRNMPNMEQLMQQLQQSGGQMTPEMTQQMEQMQQMLEQLQQQ